MRKFWLIFSILTTIICGNGAHAYDATPACLTAIGNDNATFINILKSEILKGNPFDQKLADREKNRLYNLVAANILTHCVDVDNLDSFNTEIVDATNLKIPFKMDNKYYELDINANNLFEYINLPVGIMVTNLRDKSVGDVITKAETPSDYFFSGDCSDHWVRVNIANKVPVNKAGQLAFPSYIGKEFFIDFPFGKNNRAFPGLIIAAKKGIGGSEEVVWFTNYKLARESAKQFAEALNNTACANDHLVVDVVSLTTSPSTQGNKKGWAIGAGVSAGIGATSALSAAGLISIGSGAAAAGTAAAATTGAAAVAGAAAGTAAASSAVPIVGWVIAAVAATVAVVAGTIAIAPTSLADMNQVMVMDGPYIIKQ